MPNKIRVAFFVYPSAFQNLGGGEILLLKTKEYLEKLGVYVRLFDIWNDTLENFDILHIFGAVKDCLGLMQTAKNKGVSVVLTPVFFSTLQRALHEHGAFKKKLKVSIHHLTKVIFPYFPSDRRAMLLLADAVIPNSEAELGQLVRLFKIDKNKMHVIPNCVDSGFENTSAEAFIAKYKTKDFILSVGRIEPRKNQLNFIKAMKGFKQQIVIIGNPVSDYISYYNECKALADKNVLFVDRIEHNDLLLKSAYSACRCFVSQGWFETPGLAALEAGLAGANVATTDKGCTKEYFKDFAEYFNPSDTKDIRKATEKAFYKQKGPQLREHIKKNFLWEQAAEKNLDVYNKLLNNKK
ncbi:MAG: glycosyltransferase [Candidatus Omnitrophota bacterium]